MDINSRQVGSGNQSMYVADFNVAFLTVGATIFSLPSIASMQAYISQSRGGSISDWVGLRFADIGGNAAKNTITITPQNGDTINGSTQPVVLNINNVVGTLNIVGDGQWMLTSIPAAGGGGGGGGLSQFAEFWIAEGDGVSSVAVGAPIPLYHASPANTSGFTWTAASPNVTITVAGVYEVEVNVGNVDANAVVITKNTAPIAGSVSTGSATGTATLIGSTIVTVVAGDIFTVAVSPQAPAALGLALSGKTAGGTVQTFAKITFKKLA